MVTVIFYNLLRSKYNIKELSVQAGTIHEIIAQIRQVHPEIKQSDFTSSVLFYNNNPLHYSQFKTDIKDNSRIFFTHFVGGG